MAGNIARLLVAIYVGALLAGPPPWGFLRLITTESSSLVVGEALVLTLIVPWMIAGRGLGVYAGLLGFLYWESHFFGGGMGIVMTLFIPIPIVSAWIGSWLSSRLGIGGSLDRWRHWRTAGIIVVFVAIYTFAIGPATALRTLEAKFEKVWPSDAAKVTAYAAGPYVGVDGITGCPRCGFPDTYYTDPSGLVFLYKVNLD